MTIKFSFILLGLVFCFGSSSAQDYSLSIYDREGIYLSTDLWRGTVFIKNGVTHPVGFAYKNLRKEFEVAPRTLPMFKKAQRNAKISFAIGILGLAGVSAGIITAFRGIDDQGYLQNERQYKNGLNLVWGSAVLTAAINIPLRVSSRRQLDNAIWLRNRELLGQE